MLLGDVIGLKKMTDLSDKMVENAFFTCQSNSFLAPSCISVFSLDLLFMLPKDLRLRCL